MMIRKRKKFLDRNKKMFFIGLLPVVAGLAGNMYIRTLTEGKSIEHAILDKVVGYDTPYEQFDKERLTYQEQIKQLRIENERIKASTASRGEDRKQEVKAVEQFFKTNKDGFWYDYKKLSCPEWLVKIIKAQTDKHIDKALVKDFNSTSKEFFDSIYCIISYESQFDPNCIASNSSEYSIGLLQVNTFTNFPKNQDRNKLKNPEYNLDYQLDELWQYYLLGKKKGLSGELLTQFISKYGQRPRWSSSETRNYIINTISKTRVELERAKL